MSNEEVEMNTKQESNSIKIGNVTVNVKSCFLSEKSLYEILYTIASTRLKEKSA